jgi:hypothetical protein
MKRVTCLLISALFLSGLVASHRAAGQTSGSSANGDYRFIADDGLTKYVAFEARNDDNGVTMGHMTFSDQAKIVDRDVDGDEEFGSGDTPPEFYVKAEFESLTVEKNRALMSGVVRDSSHRSYIGKWVVLVVEDNGDNLKVPDRVTWRFCRQETGGWIPSDAERKDDDGAWLRWWATDAERRDDVGIPSKNLIPGETRGCEPFPLVSYTFVDPRRWEGIIQVRP